MIIWSRASLGAVPPATVHYEAGFIVLSYIISLTGCMSALELLHRRTSTRGAFNWYLLIASSITMGGVGIWSMHFVGNRAIILENGAPDRQLLYNQGYTALSFFLPILVLIVAFYLLAISGKATKVNILIAGLLTGTAVCAMHYVGQVGIANYDCTYQPGNVAGSAIIAVFASLVALSIFFRLRDTWTDSWWKRGMCAALLAGAVSGMHWTAAVGTVYYYRMDGIRGSRSRVQTVIFCAVLSLAACVFLLAIAFAAKRRSLIHRRRAQELVLACAYFDEDDRVMVTNDGFLPYQKITKQFVRRTFGEDELNRSHPAFMWVYEASRNWSALRELIPGIQDRLKSNPAARKYQPDHEDSIDMSRTASADFNIIFKQLFCVAAERLADQIHEPMQDLGVMFEEPLETGTTKSSHSLQRRLTLDTEKSKSPKLFGKGRYLLLNRRLSKAEVADFAALGYRFGSIFQVAESLARNMQVSHELMLSRLERMKVCMSREHFYPAGNHLACFLLRPSVNAGFDVLVPSVSQNQLPLVTLPVKEMTSSHMEILQSLDELTVRDVLRELLPDEKSKAKQANDFKWELYSAFVQLVNMVRDHETMMQARFSAKPIRAPCRSLEESSKFSTCTLFSIRYIGTIHHSHTQEELSYVPFNFFGAQQLVETSNARHQAFVERAQKEFGESFERYKSRKESEARSVPAQDGPGDRSPKPRSSLWNSSQLLSMLGLTRTKLSRHNSKSGLVPGRSSGRSTAEPDTKNPTPLGNKGLNISTEELQELEPVSTLPRSSTQDPRKLSEKQINDVDLTASAESQGTFVSELFALFRLSHVSMKGKIR